MFEPRGAYRHEPPIAILGWSENFSPVFVSHGLPVTQLIDLLVTLGKEFTNFLNMAFCQIFVVIYKHLEVESLESSLKFVVELDLVDLFALFAGRAFLWIQAL